MKKKIEQPVEVKSEEVNKETHYCVKVCFKNRENAEMLKYKLHTIGYDMIEIVEE